MAFERVEATDKLRPVRLEPLVEFAEGLGAQAIQAALRVATDLDETGVAQHLEVSRHAGLVHADGIDQFGDRSLAVTDRIEDSPSSRLGDHVENVEVAGHPVNI